MEVLDAARRRHNEVSVLYYNYGQPALHSKVKMCGMDKSV